jgi:hypothetical protein
MDGEPISLTSDGDEVNTCNAGGRTSDAATSVIDVFRLLLLPPNDDDDDDEGNNRSLLPLPEEEDIQPLLTTNRSVLVSLAVCLTTKPY